MPLQAPAFLANGNINPSVFVKLDASAGNNFKVLACTANTDHIIGVAQESTLQAPGITGAGVFAATAGFPIQVYGDNDEALVLIDSGAGVTAGDYLTAAATTINGAGKTVAFTLGAGTIFAGAIALETAAASTLCRCIVHVQALTNCTA
jgi:hypothetical protein